MQAQGHMLHQPPLPSSTPLKRHAKFTSLPPPTHSLRHPQSLLRHRSRDQQSALRTYTADSPGVTASQAPLGADGSIRKTTISPSMAVPVAPAVPAAYKGGLATLVDEIQASEERLQAMFQPGQIMPKASVVSKLRASISKMQEQLRLLVAETEAEQQLGARAATPGEREALSKAKLILMGVPLLSSTFGAGTSLAGSEGYEMAYLQAENAQLRRQAHLLLLRQQLLEEVADELGIKRSQRS
ncbi:hypothetical protein DUNSADRAFT_11613 [Dunaliella salina]|uniref:Uncharacterized protein n=1 Tax=Dunaliella salina TaxID=3046 RepID=A0ABQ7GCZ1_DUNSA|nr:hypothetical protein DUNSADRAFT_11613 [Dunaliella salina]|eukprot:KAF5832476.1 hypothetical protein DUNSADRAFT_11613 [Dunaliella salina]